MFFWQPSKEKQIPTKNTDIVRLKNLLKPITVKPIKTY